MGVRREKGGVFDIAERATVRSPVLLNTDRKITEPSVDTALPS